MGGGREEGDGASEAECYSCEGCEWCERCVYKEREREGIIMNNNNNYDTSIRLV